MASESPSNALVAQPLPSDLLICIFIHGFKGDDGTFGGFPERLKHLLSHSIHSLQVDCVVFPAYETKGELSTVVDRFVDWLTTLTVNKEVAHGTGGGAGKAKIVLCGHSMGGLLAADAFLNISASRAHTSDLLWPRIVACLAYDTPYFGVHPGVFKNTATKALDYVETARSVASGIGMLGALGAGFGFGKTTSPSPTPGPSVVGGSKEKEASPTPPPADSPWSRWAPVAYGLGGALLAGAAASTVYYQKDNVAQGVSSITDHMKYVGNLWDEKQLRGRVETVIEVGKKEGVEFRTFFTYLPAKAPHTTPRTFIALPASSDETSRYFIPARNTKAIDEVAAHTGMFEASTNDGYYDLGLKTVEIIAEVVLRVQAQEGKMGGSGELKNLAHDQVSETKNEEEGAAVKAAAKETESHGGAGSSEPVTPPVAHPAPQVSAPTANGELLDTNPWA